MTRRHAMVLGLLFSCSLGAGTATAQIRGDAGFTGDTLYRNDDGSTGYVGLPFLANFFGASYTGLYVNNNGNVTFNWPSSSFYPAAITNPGTPVLAPFYADVDTRNPASGQVTYGTSVLGGRNAFGVNWLGVGYFSNRADRLNDFQLVLVDRGDIAAGDFDFEFNYGSIEWEAGSSGDGLCDPGETFCQAARAGWAAGGRQYEVPGSGVAGALVDGGPNSLSAAQRYAFQVRGGQITNLDPQTVPEPASMILLGSGLAGLSAARRRRRKEAAAE